ncbi:hypothetical protein B0O80DRAFT_451401 [Mortierella sp. GBAus27b]|nr:hypothetical protein B0O80DRAFT_451401 [Mortierella sp. GBAus27b]
MALFHLATPTLFSHLSSLTLHSRPALFSTLFPRSVVPLGAHRSQLLLPTQHHSHCDHPHTHPSILSIMTFFTFSRKDKRQRNPKSACSASTRALSLASTSHPDSAYDSSTISCSSTARSGTSSIAHRSSVESLVASKEQSPSENDGKNQHQHSPGAPTPARQLQSLQGSSTTGPARPAPATRMRSSSCSSLSRPSQPSVRVKFMAAFSRLLPRQREGTQDPRDQGKNQRHSASPPTLLQDKTGVLIASTASLTATSSAGADRDRVSGFNLFQLKRKRTAAHKAGYRAAGDPLNSITVHPLCISTASLPMPVPMSPLSATLPPLDVTAPACFPGTGPGDMATKHQQLLELNKSSKRPCSSSTRPTPMSGSTTSLTTPSSTLPPILPQGRGGRHLIPHHRNGQDPQACPPSPSTGSPSVSSFSPFRRSSIESLSLFNAVTSAATLGRPPSSVGPSPYGSPYSRQYQRSVSSWNTSLNDYPRTPMSERSVNELELVGSLMLETSKSYPDSRRGSIQSAHSVSTTASTGRSVPWSVLPNLTELQQRTKPAAAAPDTAKVPLGQGYDISTMFQMGSLSSPTPATPVSLNALA